MFRLMLGLAFLRKCVLSCIFMLKLRGLCGEVLNVTKGLQRIDHLLGIKSHIPARFSWQNRTRPVLNYFCFPGHFRNSAILLQHYQYVSTCACAFVFLNHSQVLQVEEGYKFFFFFCPLCYCEMYLLH